MLQAFLESAGTQTNTVLQPAGHVPCCGTEPPYFNDVSMAADTCGRQYVVRLVNEAFHQKTVAKLRRDYVALGLYKAGCAFRIRTPVEQRGFHESCIEKGLLVPPIAYADLRGTLVEYIPSTPLSRCGDRPDFADVLQRYLSSIREAHGQGVIYGDRHGGNALVADDGAIWQIDFDVEFLGTSQLKVFDIAEAIFYGMACAADKRKATRSIANWCQQHASEYDRDFLVACLESFYAFKSSYRNRKYERTLPHLRRLIDILCLGG